MSAHNGTRAIGSNFASLQEVRTALLTKIKESTLTAADATTLRLQPYTAQQVAQLAGLPVQRAGFRIPYFGIDGKPTEFYRFRYLEYNNGNGFAALATQNAKHQLRYAQPSGTLNELYLSPLTNWKDVASRVEIPLIITEGEMKAACACKHGLPCIGLGGVWNFRAAKQGIALLPQFKLFKWDQRIVYICFDSDAVSNPDVCNAENALATALLNLAARPFICRLPQLTKDKKCGLDDYIAAHGAQQFMDLVLPAAGEFNAAKELYQLNGEVLYVEDPGLVLRLDTRQRLSVRAFVEHAYATRTYLQTTQTATGTKTQEKSAAREWIKWPPRACVQRITYQPGAEKFTGHEFNTWPGWGCQPKRGNVQPWHNLLNHLFSGAKSDERNWFEQWLAYPIQHPGAKLYSAAVVWGIRHGTGKSLVGYSMFEIYGKNAREINERDLYSAYNDWAENKQFIMGEEITSGESKRTVADHLKGMITRRQLAINQKYIPVYTIPDCINYYFTSNHCDSFFLEDDDRRFFVHEVTCAPLPQEFYSAYAHWLYEEDGAAALHHHLQHLNLAGFLPQAPAPRTSSKIEMIENTRSDLASWVARIKEDPANVLQAAGVRFNYKLWTTTRLHGIYDPQGNSRVTPNGLARELRRAGYRKLNSGAPVQTIDGVQRLWCLDLQLQEQLLNVKPATLSKMYNDERGNKVKESKL